MPNPYEAIVQKTIQYLQANLSQELNLEKIAKAVGYSKTRLVQIFRTHTGKGVVGHLLDLRIARAKEMLQNTALNVSEIAMAVGFNSHTSFDIAFLRRAQTSPKKFRAIVQTARSRGAQANSEADRPSLWLQDSMSKGQFLDAWEPLSGQWEQGQDGIRGTGEDFFCLGLRRLVPENFTLEFEAQVLRTLDWPASTLGIGLGARHGSTHNYAFALGESGNSQGALHRSESINQINQNAVIKEGQWHRLTVTINDDTLTLVQDGQERFRYRDPFPPPYESRCRLHFFGWRSIVNLRNVSMQDLGFFPFSRSVRRADSLFNIGGFEQAQQLYLRMMEANARADNQAELQYKVAMCHLRQNNTAQVKDWAQKAATMPEGDFWAQQAQLCLLEAAWHDARIEEFSQRLAYLFPRAILRDKSRELAQTASADFERRGFLEIALLIRNQLAGLEEPGSLQRFLAVESVADTLLLLNQFERSIAHFRDLAEIQTPVPQNRVFVLFPIVDLHMAMGRTDEARKVIEEIRQITKNPAENARCLTYEGLCLCAEGRYKEAAALLETVPANFPSVTGFSKFALLSASAILTSLGQPVKARMLIEKACRIDPGYWFMQEGSRSEYEYPALFVKGDLQKAIDVLLEDARHEDGRVALHAAQMVKAGILLELSSDRAKARAIWAETVKRFPLHYCNFFAELAENLLAETSVSTQPLEQMPFPFSLRSEMFLLVGLLMMKRGDKETGERLFNLCSLEDHTNRWPAVVAHQCLADQELLDRLTGKGKL